MKARYGFLLIAVLLALAVGVSAARMGAGPGRCQANGYGMQMGMWRGLNLTADQIAQLKQINANFQTATAQLRTDIMARHKELAALIAAPTLDEAAIRAKLAEIEGLRAQMMAARNDKMIASLRVLTPDQRAKIGQRAAAAKQFRGRGAGRGRGGYGRFGSQRPVQ